MKPSPKILIGYKNSLFFARCHHTLTMSMSDNNFTKCGINLDHNTMHCPFHKRIMHGSQQVFGLPSSSFGQARKRGVSAITRVDFNFKARRDFSRIIEKRVDDNGEMVYVKGGMNVKPIVVESDDKDEDDDDVEEESRLKGGEEDEKTENSGGLKNVEEETEVEKEAWKLLQEALVTYYDSPVGTVAANDSDSEQALNYDQVFIRDFIPSALAFLLKGEKEIVKNFLLYTLQLQVIYTLFSMCVGTKT